MTGLPSASTFVSLKPMVVTAGVTLSLPSIITVPSESLTVATAVFAMEGCPVASMPPL